ncbi:MAG: type III-B CRISPR module-associated protein Cmr3 [Candidatus Thorarchaeota archaeon]|nr:type III-B CRISPR module-associated protein Cmr3 [Candidatus Thorarchaeota archaeon]
MIRALKFTPLDVLFFRDGTPFNAGEGGAVKSLFPPTPSTAYGAARAFLLEAYCTHLSDYIRRGCGDCPDCETCSIKDIVGHPSKRNGAMDIIGPYIRMDNQMYFPAPVDLGMKEQHDAKAPLFETRVPREPIECDLGSVRLPSMHPDVKHTLDSSNTVVSEEALKRYLEGNTVVKEDVKAIWESVEGPGTPSLVYDEFQVGIAIERDRRAAKEHHLYAIKFARPVEGLELWIGLDGVTLDKPPHNGILMRFGGEGKRAFAQAVDEHTLLKPEIHGELSKTGHLKILLLQHADFDGTWLLPEFEQITDEDGITSWRGKLGDFEMNLITASIGRPVYAGGWDMAAGRPRALRALVPAGSVYYLKINPEQAEQIVRKLHGSKIGRNTNIGYGHIALGVWNE